MADPTPRLASEADLPRLREIVGAACTRHLDRMDRPPFPMLADLHSRVLEQQRPATRHRSIGGVTGYLYLAVLSEGTETANLPQNVIVRH